MTEKNPASPLEYMKTAAGFILNEVMKTGQDAPRPAQKPKPELPPKVFRD